MNPKVAIIAVVVGIAIYAASMLNRGSTEDHLRALGESSAPAVPTAVDPANAYKLTILITAGDESNQVSQALRDALAQRVQPFGLSMTEGALGDVRAEATVKSKEYRSMAGTPRSVPYEMRMTLEVSTQAGGSSWDGRHTLKATVAEPAADLAEDSASALAQSNVDALLKQMLSKLDALGPFKRS